ncbi:hypothetical protein WJX72_000797 [[Myrmecia] bisecta]|uniref:Oxidoreductase n=1 Tax=[Myrmecia] bisecta TaxID=41462 RepID=A0AAW1PWF7_9CHLO
MCERTNIVRIGWIGAGGINFGSLEGPWNHAIRLERFEDVVFTAVVDPNTSLAQQRVEDHSKGEFGSKWSKCKVYKDYHDMLADPEGKPDAVVIGIPPWLHGAVRDPALNMEVQLAEAGVHMLIEKPISMQPAEEVEELAQVLDKLGREKRLVIAVGYMLRFNPAIEAVKHILQEEGVQPVTLVGRYSCPYDNIRKPQWWDTQKSGGPIVEQCTHFVDLMRYLSGSEIVKDSIQTKAIGPSMQLSRMPEPPHAEHTILMERRNNRATVSIFDFANGAIGSLTHTLLLHGSNFYTEFELVGDGLSIVVRDPYQNPQVLVRRPMHNEHEEVKLDLDSDMYVKQFEAFLHAIRTGDTSGVRCLYHDAARTYQSAWPFAKVCRAVEAPDKAAASESLLRQSSTSCC